MDDTHTHGYEKWSIYNWFRNFPPSVQYLSLSFGVLLAGFTDDHAWYLLPPVTEQKKYTHDYYSCRHITDFVSTPTYILNPTLPRGIDLEEKDLYDFLVDHLPNLTVLINRDVRVGYSKLHKDVRPLLLEKLQTNYNRQDNPTLNPLLLHWRLSHL
jgi:hypothetical protein